MDKVDYELGGLGRHVGHCRYGSHGGQIGHGGHCEHGGRHRQDDF